MKQKYVKTSALEVVHPKVYVVRGQKVVCGAWQTPQTTVEEEAQDTFQLL